MAIALVQQVDTGSISGSVFTLTITSSGAGNLLTLCFTNVKDSTHTISSVTDSASQTWVKANQENDNTHTADSEIWYFQNTVSGVTSVKVTLTGSSPLAYDYNAAEWSGVAISAARDGHPAGTTGTSATALAPSITPTVGNELFLAIVASGTTGGLSGSVGGGFTGLTWNSNSNLSKGGYLISTDSSAHQMTWGQGGSDLYSGTAASFQPPSTFIDETPLVVTRASTLLRSQWV